MREIKTVALIGLGAIGCSIARELRQAVRRENFRVIADGERAARIAQGVEINGESCCFDTVSPAAQTGPADLVIVAVKYLALPQAIEDMRGQIGPDTMILSFLNGVDSEAKIAAVYGWEHMLYGLVRRSIVKEGNRCIFDAWGTYYFGEKTNDVRSERVQAVCNLFDRAGLHWEVPRDMVRDQWVKFMANISENQSSAILGIPYGAWQVEGSDANWVREAACREAIAVANALGIDIGEQEILNQRKIIQNVKPESKTSMLQDIEAGRPTEVAMLAGELCRLGREHGVPTPINDLFYHMIRVLEQKHKKDVL